MDANVRGKTRVTFAPFAEALKVTTDSVMSVQADEAGTTFTVLYTETPTRDPDAMLFRARMWTNIEGILEVTENRRICTLRKFREQVQAIMDGVREPLPDDPTMQ